VVLLEAVGPDEVRVGSALPTIDVVHSP
jgi:hypothetical protein